MTQDKVDMYVMTNQKYLPAEKIVFLKQKLLEIDEAKFSLVSAVEFKDPTTLLLVSIFLGSSPTCWWWSPWLWASTASCSARPAWAS